MQAFLPPVGLFVGFELLPLRALELTQYCRQGAITSYNP
jgi:hypothetical protein